MNTQFQISRVLRVQEMGEHQMIKKFSRMKNTFSEF